MQHTVAPGGPGVGMVSCPEEQPRLQARPESTEPDKLRASALAEQAMRSVRALAVSLARQAAREDDAAERGSPAQAAESSSSAQAARPDSAVDEWS